MVHILQAVFASSVLVACILPDGMATVVEHEPVKLFARFGASQHCSWFQ